MLRKYVGHSDETMRQLASTPTSHRDAFIERYDDLSRWALQLARGDRERAEDLLHDAFVQFVVAAPHLGAVENLDAYLYTMLRNLHVSQVRRETRRQFSQLSIVDYDSARTGLRAKDPRDLIQAQDDLRRVCHYACARSRSSSAAGVLILRFFHGYFPSEIARVLRRTRRVVDERLRVTRAEARLVLENPKAISFPEQDSIPPVLPASVAKRPADFLLELREVIFRSRRGECLPAEYLSQLYGAGGSGSLSHEAFAHAVSCARCLDEVNRRLGLPPLADRYPTDTMGKDMDNTGGPGGSSATGPADREVPSSWDRDAREVFEHKPTELSVAINGHVLGSQRVGLDRNVLTLNVTAEEKIEFAEVFSEQGVRLMLLAVDGPPPAGPGEYRSRVRLSDDRELDVDLTFSSPWPTISLVYSDPDLRPELAAAHDLVDGSDDAAMSASASTPEPYPSPLEPMRHLARRLRASLASWQFWLRPGTVTAALTLALIASLVTVPLLMPTSTVSAAEVLTRSSAAEREVASDPNTVVHRTLTVAEHSVPDGALVARRRVEIWRSAGKGVTARRLYDDQGRLVGGEWLGPDGVGTVYTLGLEPSVEAEATRAAERLLEPNAVWRLDPSAEAFSKLIGDPARAGIDERGGEYVVRFATDSNPRADGLVSATLVVGRDDLRPRAQTLVVSRGGRTREYRFAEEQFERRPLSAVDASVFEPDAALSGGAASPSSVRTTAGAPPTLAAEAQPATAAVASPELEVEVLRLLAATGADLGEQVSVARAPGGPVSVTGIVETAERQAEIRTALAPVAKSPAVRIDIMTIAEALERQRLAKAAPAAAPRAESVAIHGDAMPAEAALRAHFAADGDRAGDEARQFAARAVATSRRAMQHLWAMRRLTKQFSPAELGALTPEARAAWMGLVREHARAYAELSAGLRRDLKPIFFAGAPEGGARAEEIHDAAALVRAVERLFEAGSANDAVLRSAFTATSDGQGATAIGSPQFWQAMKDAEALAGRLASAP